MRKKTLYTVEIFDIKDFIERRWLDTDANWTNGNCYWFAFILVTQFPKLKIYYSPIIGHFVAGDGVHFFDAEGEYIPTEDLISLERIKKKDPCLYKRLLRDCKD